MFDELGKLIHERADKSATLHFVEAHPLLLELVQLCERLVGLGLGLGFVLLLLTLLGLSFLFRLDTFDLGNLLILGLVDYVLDSAQSKFAFQHFLLDLGRCFLRNVLGSLDGRLADAKKPRGLLVSDPRFVELIISKLGCHYPCSNQCSLALREMSAVKVGTHNEPKGITAGIGSEVFFLELK